MWPEFIHHITLHFPIVLALVIAGVGLWSLKDEAPQLRKFVRWVGWVCFAFTTVVVVSGIIAAPGWLGGDGSPDLSHHRNLGLTTWVVVAIATFGYEYGVREDIADWRKFAVGIWCVASFAVIGTGHWGGTEQHQDKLPWAVPEAPELTP